MTATQIVLVLATVAALVVTVVAYPNKYGALSGRSRLFRTVGMAIFDLLLMLVTLATFIDFRVGVAPRLAPIREGFYLASCFFLCFALMCVCALDALESISRLRRESRESLDSILRTEIEKARAEFASKTAQKQSETTEDRAGHDDPAA